MNDDQEKQVKLQLKAHEHEDYKVNIYLTPEVVLKDFQVDKGVFRPDVTISLHLARWLYYNNGDYLGKNVADIGCGTGLQGIVMGLQGAKKVEFTDVSFAAISNVYENISNFPSIMANCPLHYLQGDLLENISSDVDYVVFNHPFFSGDPIKDVPISKTMLGGTELIHEFMNEVRLKISGDPKIIMPYYHLAGEENDPSIQCKKHLFKSDLKYRGYSSDLQDGIFSIYELNFDHEHWERIR